MAFCNTDKAFSIYPAALGDCDRLQRDCIAVNALGLS